MRQTTKPIKPRSRRHVQKTKRVSVDLAPAASAEIDRMRATTGLATADLFRHAITLLRIYLDARRDGKEFRIVDPSNLGDQVRLEMPISIEFGSARIATA